MTSALSTAEFARHAGLSVDQIDEWRSLGLITGATKDRIHSEDVERVRLIQLLLRRGVSVAAIVRAERDEHFLARCVGWMLGDGVGSTSTVAELARASRMPADTLRRLVQAAGLGEQGEIIDDEDGRALERINVALDAGLPEEAVLQFMRVCRDTLGRVAEAEARLFHIYCMSGSSAMGYLQARAWRCSKRRRNVSGR